MDFAFWDKISILGFTSMLAVIDACTHLLWLFCTASKRPPLEIVEYFLVVLEKKGHTVKTIYVDEDGSLARSVEFTAMLIKHSITLDTTGGYNAWLNGRFERANRTISKMTRAFLINSGHSDDKWCFDLSNDTSFKVKENSF